MCSNKVPLARSNDPCISEAYGICPEIPNSNYGVEQKAYDNHRRIQSITKLTRAVTLENRDAATRSSVTAQKAVASMMRVGSAWTLPTQNTRARSRCPGRPSKVGAGRNWCRDPQGA